MSKYKSKLICEDKIYYNIHHFNKIQKLIARLIYKIKIEDIEEMEDKKLSEVTINNSPIHSQSIITREYGYISSSYSCGWHTGVDFAPYGSTETNPLLYSCVYGEVAEVNLNPNNTLGVYVVIKDLSNNYWRYCHMVQGSVNLNVGDTVNLNTVVGRMGATGNVTGIHLHLEYASTLAWNCQTFMNPCSYLNIPNESGTIVNYDGSQPSPVSTFKKSKFPWVLYARKLRNKNS